MYSVDQIYLEAGAKGRTGLNNLITSSFYWEKLYR